MRHKLSLAFFISGLPILFIVREFIPYDKVLVTNILGASLLLLLPNYKNLFSFKLYSNSFLVFFNLNVIFILFFIISFYKYGLNEQSINIAISIFFIIALLSVNNNELNLLHLYVLFISSLCSLLTLYFVPTGLDYWALNGGRLYVGDTKNPSITSWSSMVNVFSIYFTFIYHKISLITKILLIIICTISLFLYFMAFSKSSIIGIFLILLFFSYKYLNKINLNKKFIALFFATVGLLMGFSNYLLLKSKLIFNTFESLLFGKKEVMSAYVRYENFQKSFGLFDFNNLFGFGISTFRMDSPILQASLDFGIFIGFFLLFISIIFPLIILFTVNLNKLRKESKFIIVIFLFFLPNFFFHGTPYDWMIWLPLLLFYKFKPKVKLNFIDFSNKRFLCKIN